MIKICHLTSVHSPFDVRIFHKECKTLVKAGYDVTLIAQHDKNETVDGIKIVALPKIKNRTFRMIRLPLKTLWFALKKKADVYHLHDPELLPVGVFLKLFKAKNIIYDVHEDYAKQKLSEVYIPKIARTYIAFLIRTTEYLSSKLFNGIITATENILKNFSHHKRAKSIRNFPIISNFSAVKRNNDTKINIFNLIYIGILTEIRGITQIIKALDLINSNKKIKLTLYGQFYPPYYKEKAMNLRGFKKVEYLGWTEPRTIPGLLKKSDAGIVCFLPEPNHIHAMPNKIFDYMAAGLPVIASNFPLWKEIVEENMCGICVNPLKQKEIAKALKYLMEHPKLRKKMGENGRKAVLEKYNWEQESKKLLNLYDDMLDRKSTRNHDPGKELM